MPPENIDSLDPDSLKPLLLSLLKQNEQLLAQVNTLLARIAELEATTKGKPPKSPTNSSLPPSTGQKSNVPPSSGAKKRRKGRPGVARELAANPDETRNVYADRCTCGSALSQANQTLAHAYDHIDLPPIKPVTTRINLHRSVCTCCNKRVTAQAPADMAPGSPFGSGIVSIAAYLHGCHMVSYDRLTEVFAGLLGLKISEGAIANMLARAAVPFAAEAGKIADAVRASPVVASDETSARVVGKTWWQWVFSSASAVWHTIVPTRGKCVPVEFLGGAKPDVWISDRLAAQGHHAEAHQYCLAHLMSDLFHDAEIRSRFTVAVGAVIREWAALEATMAQSLEALIGCDQFRARDWAALIASLTPLRIAASPRMHREARPKTDDPPQ